MSTQKPNDQTEMQNPVSSSELVSQPTIRQRANHAWNNLNFAKSILDNQGATQQAKDLIDEAQGLCDSIVHDPKAG